MGEMRNSNKIAVGRLEVKTPLRRPSRIWEDNIKMSIVDWIQVEQYKAHCRALVNTVVTSGFHKRVPSISPLKIYPC
jgi:hypothetical protein